MARRANYYRTNSGSQRRAQNVCVIVTALAERDGSVLLAQLAQGPFAGFWLLPSATVDEGTVTRAVGEMLLERTGYPALDQRLLTVQEETKIGVLALRFVFTVRAGERESGSIDPEIVQARWFTRDAVREVLEERDVVPTLGVMALLRTWLEERTPASLETPDEQARCPCGSGFSFAGCCGWDSR